MYGVNALGNWINPSYVEYDDDLEDFVEITEHREYSSMNELESINDQGFVYDDNANRESDYSQYLYFHDIWWIL